MAVSSKTVVPSAFMDAFFSVAAPLTLASLVADIANCGDGLLTPEVKFLRDEAMQALIANVGELEAVSMIDAANGVSLSPVEMLARALDRCGMGWSVAISNDKASVVVRAGHGSSDPLASLVAIHLEEDGFDQATFEAVNLCDGVVVVTPLVG